MLLVCRTSTDFLLANGNPVWPIRDDSDDASVRAIAATFGAQVVETEAVPGAAEGGTEVVVALGAQNEGSARLYAHLTRRLFHVVKSLDEVGEVKGARVVICQWSHLTFSGLARIQEWMAANGPIGLLVGQAPGTMRHQVLTRAAAACLPGAPTVRGTLVCPDLNIGTKQSAHLELFGRNADPAQLVNALAAGSQVVAFSGHGDGLDMELGAKTVLCGVRAQGERLDLSTAPECASSRYCYRKHSELTASLGTGDLIDPDILCCRAAVACSCFVVPAHGALVHPGWSLLGRWLDSSKVGCVLAPVGLSHGGLEEAAGAARTLLGCSSVGDALGELNRSYHLRCGRGWLFLFGDPHTRISAYGVLRQEQQRSVRRSLTVDAKATVRTPQLVETSDRAVQRRLLLRDVLERVRTDTSGACPHDELAMQALRCLSDVERWAPEGGHASAAMVEHASKAVLRCLLGRKPLWNYLAPLSNGICEVDASQHCTGCGERVHVMRYTIAISGVSPRLQGHCDRCGIVFDVEEGSSLLQASFELQAGCVVLPPPLRDPAAKVGLVLRPWWRRASTWELTEGTRGEPTIGELGPGITTAFVLAVINLELVLLRRLFDSCKRPGVADGELLVANARAGQSV